MNTPKHLIEDPRYPDPSSAHERMQVMLRFTSKTLEKRGVPIVMTVSSYTATKEPFKVTCNFSARLKVEDNKFVIRAYRKEDGNVKLSYGTPFLAFANGQIRPVEPQDARQFERTWKFV